MKVKVTYPGEKPTGLTTKDMKIGDVAEVIDELHRGALLLQTYAALIDLRHPHSTWSGSDPELEIKLLPEGSLVTLEVE